MSNGKKLEKTEVKSLDEMQKEIIASALYFNVVFFQPGTSKRETASFELLTMAKAYAIVVMKEPNRFRCAMIYAIVNDNTNALVGTIGRNLLWKPVFSEETT